MPRYFENALLLLTGRTRIPLPSLSKSSLSPLRTPRASPDFARHRNLSLAGNRRLFLHRLTPTPYFTIVALLWLDSCKIASHTQARQLLTRRKWKKWVVDFLEDSFIPYYLAFRSG